MAINRNDDYEKLAKLLYPSIEASGNTYYGQTRKLTLDEVFNKNNGGFESHIESVRVDNPSADYGFTYDTLFYWKVGPLNGTLKVDVEYNIGTYFAIYEIISEPVTNVNQLNSGEFNTHFNTYEYNTGCEFKEVKETGGKSPVNISDVYDGRNFYIYKDGIKNYIAVAVNCDGEVPYDENNPLKLTAVSGQVNIELFIVNEGSLPIIDDATHPMYDYSTDECETWNWCELSISDLHSGEYIQLNPGESAYFRLNTNAVKSFNTDRFVYFKFTGNGKIVASGDIRSMKQDPSGNLEFCEFNRLFWNCVQLIKAPSLPDKQLAGACYIDMFRGCTSLTKTPKLIASELAESCYARMFSGCTSLNKVICYASDISEQNCTYLWLRNVANTGEFVTLNGTNWQIDSEDGIPTGWTRINMSDPTEYIGEDCKHNYLVTDGSNSSENGRGSVTSKSTLYNMESSFDENGTHQMNTYNADGSFNQEIWGYKCFNSPVQFKNGIYGEQAKLITAHETKDTSGNNNWVFHDTWDGSKLSTDNASVSVLKTRNIGLTNDTETQYDLSGSSTYISAGNIAYSSIGNIYNGDTDNSTYGSMCATAFHTGTSGSGVWTVSDVVLKSCLDKSCYSIIELSSNKNEYTDNTVINNSEIKLESYSNNTDYAKILLNYNNTRIGNYNSNSSNYINITATDGIDIHSSILPTINNTYDFGSTNNKWRNIYTKNILAGLTGEAVYNDRGFNINTQNYEFGCIAYDMSSFGDLSIYSSSTFSDVNKDNAATIKIKSSTISTSYRPSISFVITDEDIAGSINDINVASIEYDSSLTKYVFKADRASFNKIYVSDSTFSNIITAEEIYILSSSDHTVDATLKLQSNAISVSKDIAPANNSGSIQNCGRLEYPWNTIYAKNYIVLTAGETSNHVFTIAEDDGCVILDNSLPGGDYGVFLFATNDGNSRAKLLAKEYVGFNSTISDINPRTGSSYKIAVGSLVFAIPGVTWTDAKRGQTFNPGDILDFTNTANGLWFVARQNVNSSAGTVSWDHGASEPEDTLQPGKYKLLNILKINDYGTHVANVDSPVLLQRVE